ncbi:hypothetical protein JOE56_000986 [Brevibacterium paucivorans]|uniref:Uncharacterized protein n=1 Tax=Brevibacterium paucivorans TaxID=170994 RepID=A0ABS2SJ54_9MICO|nr:hypothetical protein [Brevibacterium paucivorans]
MSSMRDGVEKLLTALAEWRKVSETADYIAQFRSFGAVSRNG